MSLLALYLRQFPLGGEILYPVGFPLSGELNLILREFNLLFTSNQIVSWYHKLTTDLIRLSEEVIDSMSIINNHGLS